jgi:hypothetical protein
MQQGKVLIGVTLLMVGHRLFELSHDRGQSIALVEPMGKQMHPHKREVRGDLDDLGWRGNRSRGLPLAGSTLAPIEPASAPPAIEMTQAHCEGEVTPCDLGE